MKTIVVSGRKKHTLDVAKTVNNFSKQASHTHTHTHTYTHARAHKLSHIYTNGRNLTYIGLDNTRIFELMVIASGVVKSYEVIVKLF